MKENTLKMQMMKRVLMRKMTRISKMKMTTTRRLKKTTYRMMTTMASKTRKMMSMIMNVKMTERNVKLMPLSNRVWSNGVIKTSTTVQTMKMIKMAIAIQINFLSMNH